MLSAGLTWHVVGQGLAWAELDKPADAVKYTMTKRGKGRKFAVMVFTPGKDFSGVIYLTSVKRGLNAGQVVTEGQLLDLYHGQEEKPAATKKTEKKPAKKASQPVKTVKTSQPAAEKKPVKASQEKPATKKPAKKTSPQKPASQPAQPAGLQFGPALVADKAGKITIASLLHAGKVFASRTVPAEFEKRFEKYSEDNRLLLYVQGGPDLGPVSTYRGWLKKGRQVTKGQHGLKILAPRMVPDENGNPKIDGLRLVTLFSIEQTEKLEMKEA